MSNEIRNYVQGIVWDPPLEDFLPSLVGTRIAARDVSGTIVHLNTLDAVEEARSSLKEMIDDEWDWDGWLRRGTTAPGSPVLGVRGDSSGRIVGFCAMETNVDIRSDPAGAMIDLEIEIASVYIRPADRGLGFGSILRKAAATYAVSIIGAISAIPSDDLTYLHLAGLSVRVHAHPESHGGHAFANRVSGDIETYLSLISDGAWFGRASFNDETDPEDAPSMS